MADKDPNKDKGTRKYADKFLSEDELEKGYMELAKKLDEQGAELGSSRKAREAAEQTLAQYTEWKKTVDPMLQGYQQYQPILQYLASTPGAVQALQTYATGTQLTAQPGTAGGAQNTLDLLSADEKTALYKEAAKYMQEQVLNPWSKQFASTVETWGGKQTKDLEDRWAKIQQANNDVWWRTFERTLPKEKIDEMKAYHKQSLEYADTSKLDPLALASDKLAADADIARLREENDKLKADAEARAKQQTSSLGNGNSFMPTPTENETPAQNPEARFAAAMTDLEKEHGVDGVRTLFPSLGR